MCIERAHLLLACFVFACQSSNSRLVTGNAQYTGDSLHAGIVVAFEGGSSAYGVTEVDGRFSVGVPQGRYAVTFSARDSVEGTRRTFVDVGDDGAVLEDVFFSPVGRVAGRVTDARTQKPVSDALIVLTDGSRGTETDFDGAFALSSVPVGKATVAISFAGLAAQLKTVALSRGQLVDIGTVALGPVMSTQGPAAIDARVVFPDGTPAPGAEIHIAGSTISRTTFADSEGRFRFERLPSGIVKLRATAPGYEAVLDSVFALEGSAGISVGRALFPLAENPIELVAGEYVSDTASTLVTPDGRTLLGTNRRGALVAVDLTTKNERVVLSEPELGAPRVEGIGPDGATLALAFQRDRDSQFLLASTANTGRQIVVEHGCFATKSRDALLVRDDIDCDSSRAPLLKVPLRFGGPTVSLGQFSHPFIDTVHSKIFDVTPSPDGGMGDLFVVSYEPSLTQQTLVSGVRRILGASFDFSRLVLFDEGISTDVGEVVQLDVKSGAVYQVASNGHVLSKFEFDKNGRLYFSHWPNLIVFDSVGNRVHTISNVKSFAVAPGGEAVAIARGADTSELFTLSWLYENSEVALGSDVKWYQWSPDGRSLLFIDQVEVGRDTGRLRLQLATGGPSVELDRSVVALSPIFSPSSPLVAFIHRNSEQWWLAAARLDTQRVALVAEVAPSPARLASASFSPNGKWVTWSATVANEPAPRFVRSIEPGSIRPVVFGEVHWLKGGAALLRRPDRGVNSSGTWYANFD